MTSARTWARLRRAFGAPRRVSGSHEPQPGESWVPFSQVW